MADTFDVWITKYALTEGIFRREAELCSETRIRTKDSWTKCYHKPEWHRTEAEAIAQAEKMRLDKIRCLKAQLHKLENMKFEPEQHDNKPNA